MTTVRDHRTAPANTAHRPVVRDHRTETPTRPVVRDHRTEAPARPVIRDHRHESGLDKVKHYAQHLLGHHPHRHHVRDHRAQDLFHRAIDAFKNALSSGAANVSPAAVQTLQSVAQQGILPSQAGVLAPPESLGLPSTGAQIPTGVPPFADRTAVGLGTDGFTAGGLAAQASNVDLVNQIANAPLFSPEEELMMKNLPPEQQAMMKLQAKKQRESLMSSTLTNICNMKHEQLKAVAGNLRG